MRGEGTPRLQDITVEVGDGVSAVIGPSGSGKTSLLNLLVGFEIPDKGCIETSLPQGTHVLPLYWVPQNGGLWRHLNVREHLEAVMPPKIPEGRLLEILDSLDIADKTASYPHQLSQGERARVSVARAMASSAGVLVMDEPFVSVDPARIPKYWEALRGNIRDFGTALVFSTHRPEAVLREARRVICLKDGRLLHAGGVEELYRRPTSRELAKCLGEANWFEPGEAQLWLNVAGNNTCCWRPEQISIKRADDGAFVVESSRFAGAVAEVKLRHSETGQFRTFFHRPPSNNLHRGEHVSIEIRRETQVG